MLRYASIPYELLLCRKKDLCLQQTSVACPHIAILPVVQFTEIAHIGTLSVMYSLLRLSILEVMTQNLSVQNDSGGTTRCLPLYST